MTNHMTLEARSKVSKKGQVTVPKSIRDLLGIGVNSEVIFKAQGNEIKLEKAHKDIWSLEKEARKLNGVSMNYGTPEVDWGNDFGEENLD